MNKSYNVPLRVQHFNKQIWDKEGKINFEPKLGIDQNDPLNYTSELYQTFIQEGGVLDVQDGWCKLYTNSSKTEIEVQGQSFLHILYYLANKEQKSLEAWAEEQNAIEDATFGERQKEMEALEAEEEVAEQGKATSQNVETSTGKADKPLEWEERDGVTYLKGTNFVLSKIC